LVMMYTALPDLSSIMWRCKDGKLDFAYDRRASTRIVNHTKNVGIRAPLD